MKARLDNKIGSRSRQLYREEDAPRGEADMDRELDFMIFLGPKRGGGGTRRHLMRLELSWSTLQ
jgi:hypothetical protein